MNDSPSVGPPACAPVTASTDPSARHLIARCVCRASQLRCWIHGHLLLTHYGSLRLSLRCAWCGYETAGWELRKRGFAHAVSGRWRPSRGSSILLGASGAGKSVVLKLILGQLKPDSGAIHFNGAAHQHP